MKLQRFFLGIIDICILQSLIGHVVMPFVRFDNKFEEFNKGKCPWRSFCNGAIIYNGFKYILCKTFMDCDFEALIIFRDVGEMSWWFVEVFAKCLVPWCIRRNKDFAIGFEQKQNEFLF